MDKKKFSEIIKQIFYDPLEDSKNEDFPTDVHNIGPIDGVIPIPQSPGSIVYINKSIGNGKRNYIPTSSVSYNAIEEFEKQSIENKAWEDPASAVIIEGWFNKKYGFTSVRIDNKEIFDLANKLSELEVLTGFNKTLHEYALDQAKPEKDRSSPGFWQKILDNIIDWFAHPGNPDINDVDSWFGDNEIGSTDDFQQNDDEKFNYPKQEESRFIGTISENIQKEDVKDSLWAIADDMRHRKVIGEFYTYREAYQWAADHYTQNGKPITAMQLENNYYKTDSTKGISKIYKSR